MTYLEDVREALRAAKLRAGRGDITPAEYERLKADLLADLSSAERAELGLTPHPDASPRSSGQRSSARPLGGRTEPPRLADLDLAPGNVLFDQWRITRELGRGGFGAVFAAEELHLGEIHAIKVLDPAMVARDELLARFRREVSLMRKLVHPRIVRVFDYREDLTQHLALISMEYVEGCALRDVLALAKQRNQPIPVTFALTVLQQTLEALVQAHGQGVIHRDVTPGNILLAGAARSSSSQAPATPRSSSSTSASRGWWRRASSRRRAGCWAPRPTSRRRSWTTPVTSPRRRTSTAPGRSSTSCSPASPLSSPGTSRPATSAADLSEGASALVMACVAARPERRSGAAQALARLAPLLQDAIDTTPSRSGSHWSKPSRRPWRPRITTQSERCSPSSSSPTSGERTSEIAAHRQSTSLPRGDAAAELDPSGQSEPWSRHRRGQRDRGPAASPSPSNPPRERRGRRPRHHRSGTVAGRQRAHRREARRALGPKRSEEEGSGRASPPGGRAAAGGGCPQAA